MLATIRNRIRLKLVLLALLALPIAFTSCATKKDTATVTAGVIASTSRTVTFTLLTYP